MSDQDAIRAQLQRRLELLTERASAIGSDLRRPSDRDWQERAVELENDEVLENLDEATRAEVRQLRVALRRLDAGTYGVCAKCGGPISAARLAALPSVSNCVTCAGG